MFCWHQEMYSENCLKILSFKYLKLLAGRCKSVENPPFLLQRLQLDSFGEWRWSVVKGSNKMSGVLPSRMRMERLSYSPDTKAPLIFHEEAFLRFFLPDQIIYKKTFWVQFGHHSSYRRCCCCCCCWRRSNCCCCLTKKRNCLRIPRSKGTLAVWVSSSHWGWRRAWPLRYPPFLCLTFHDDQ